MESARTRASARTSGSAPTRATGSPLRVLVAGAGIAGVEALLALRDLAGDRVATTLLAPEEHFTYRPFAVAEPFGLGHARQVPVREIAAAAGAMWERDALAGVDDAHGLARTTSGRELTFDALLVAVGATPVAAVEHALTWTPDDAGDALGGLLRDVEDGYARRLAFVVPSGPVWPLPAYELALMTAREAADMGMPAEITVVTPEPAPLAFLGDAAVAALRAALEHHGIALRAGAPATVEAAPRLRVRAGDADIEVDRVVAVPVLEGPAIPGLPADAGGFVSVDAEGRVDGAGRTWAAGDGVAYPVKFGGVATALAARAATAVARLAGADPPDPPAIELRGVLMTGGAPETLTAGRPGRRSRAPLWWPAGKVSGRYLPAVVGERDDDPSPPPGAGVPIVRRLDPAATGWLYDPAAPLRPAGGREIGDLGHRMRAERRRLGG